MSDQAESETGDGAERIGAGPEGGEEALDTIAFRMREIQRLLSMRVEQENRRLGDEGVEPVTTPRFITEED